MKALVTGGSGFLGQHVVAALLRAGHAVRTLGRRPPEKATRDVEHFTADLAAQPSLNAALAGVDVLIHLAAAMDGTMCDMHRINVDGTRDLLNAMANSRCRRLVHASSFSVYDWSRIGDTISETSPILTEATWAGCDDYAITKTRQEQLVRDVAKANGWVLTVLRAPVIWSPGHWSTFALGPHIGPIQVVFAPSAKIRLVRVGEAAEAFVLAASRAEPPQELVLNVISDAGWSARDYAKLVNDDVGGIPVPVPYTVGHAAARLAAVFGRTQRMPFFLRHRVFEALYKPVTWRNERLRAAFSWPPTPPLNEIGVHSRP